MLTNTLRFCTPPMSITTTSRSGVVYHCSWMLREWEKLVRGRRPIPSSCSKMAPTAQSLASIVYTTGGADLIARSAGALMNSF